ncbi:hypothetical protein GCM10007103_03290 [Salinimicrobium marinum]|uniref:Cytochrome c domain-containing protein n=2 Tax=Salinimicrobium marinum TaxID=680283 RepID=A0A918VUI5_9FLAO|nr:hypothetical protein GCM10007103_03290 [Salinimicrobium marinum]
MKKETIWFIISILFLTGTKVSSCSTPKTVPYARVVEMPNENLKNGRILFNNHCATCHPEGLSGVGLAIINKPLPKGLIKFQIRNGIGLMPAFNEEQLSDGQVENIAEYLLYLRKDNSKD